jgi:transposase
VQVVIALIVTSEGFPLGYEVLPGNTADCTTLRDMPRKIEAQYGRANRLWVMDRGIPTEEVLAEMRAADPPVSYLVGTPKGRLSKLEKHLVRCARARRKALAAGTGRARKDRSLPSQCHVVETFAMPVLISLTFFAELGKLG